MKNLVLPLSNIQRMVQGEIYPSLIAAGGYYSQGKSEAPVVTGVSPGCAKREFFSPASLKFIPQRCRGQTVKYK
ncbi:MAG: hypothetical protein WCI20_15225 [bacterium]